MLAKARRVERRRLGLRRTEAVEELRHGLGVREGAPVSHILQSHAPALRNGRLQCLSRCHGRRLALGASDDERARCNAAVVGVCCAAQRKTGLRIALGIGGQEERPCVAHG